MKYLWNLVLEENKRGFTYYECTSEVERNHGLATPKTKVKSYSPGHSEIKPIFDAATKLCENGKVKVGTENGRTFTKEQFDAIFEFLDVLIKHNWFN